MTTNKEYAELSLPRLFQLYKSIQENIAWLKNNYQSNWWETGSTKEWPAYEQRIKEEAYKLEELRVAIGIRADVEDV